MSGGFRSRPFREDQLALIPDGVVVKNPEMIALEQQATANNRRRKAKTPAERKQRQKAKEAALGVERFEMRLTRGERELIRAGAERGGFEDQTEYLIKLVRNDQTQNVTIHEKRL